MIREALELLMDAGKPDVKEIANYNGERTFLIKTADDNYDRETVRTRAAEWRLEARTLDGFFGALQHALDITGVAAPVPVTVDVTAGAVRADLAFNALTGNRATELTLVPHEAWLGFEDVMAEQTQRRLWEKLIGPLSGCVDPALLVVVSQLNASVKQGQTSSLDEFGIQSNVAEKTVSVQFPGRKGVESQTLPTGWTWTVPRWATLEDETWEIKTRMVLDVNGSDGINFRFFPERLASIKVAMGERLEELVRDKAAMWEVSERVRIMEGVL